MTLQVAHSLCWLVCRLLQCLLKFLSLEREQHQLISLSIQHRLHLLSLLFLGLFVLDVLQLLMFLQVIEGTSLPLNHIAMREGEVVQFLHLLGHLLVECSPILLIFQDLISLDKC